MEGSYERGRGGGSVPRSEHLSLRLANLSDKVPSFWLSFKLAQTFSHLLTPGAFIPLKTRRVFLSCVLVWVLFSVLSIFLVMLFGDHTRPQHQETPRIISNLPNFGKMKMSMKFLTFSGISSLVPRRSIPYRSREIRHMPSAFTSPSPREENPERLTPDAQL